jgi:hypothetical protein
MGVAKQAAAGIAGIVAVLFFVVLSAGICTYCLKMYGNAFTEIIVKSVVFIIGAVGLWFLQQYVSDEYKNLNMKNVDYMLVWKLIGLLFVVGLIYQGMMFITGNGGEISFDLIMPLILGIIYLPIFFTMTMYESQLNTIMFSLLSVTNFLGGLAYTLNFSLLYVITLYCGIVFAILFSIYSVTNINKFVDSLNRFLIL